MPFIIRAFLFFISISAVAEDKVYLVGVEDINYYPLYNFSHDSTDQSSFTKELLTTFFVQQNLKFKFVPLPIKRFDKWYLEHNIDFKFPDNFRWRNDLSNKLGIHFSEPVQKLVAGTYVAKSNKDITRKDVNSVATIMGFHPTLWVREIAKGKITLQEETNPLAIVRHVLRGNVTATNIDANVIRVCLDKLDRQGEIVLAENIFHEEFYYHFSSIDYPEIIDAFNRFLLDNKPLIEQLKKKYLIVE